MNGFAATAKRDIPVLVIHRGQCNLYVGNGKENILASRHIIYNKYRESKLSNIAYRK